MSNVTVKNASGATVSFKTDGVGTDLDPHVSHIVVDTLPALAAGTNNIGDVDVLTLPALPAGTNNIGDVDVLSLPALPAGTNNIGDVDVLTLPALPAGTNNIGDVDILSIAAGDNNIGNVDIVTMPAVDTELTTADLDTGVGTDTRAVIGLVGSASGGGQIIPGSSTDGLLVNLGANNDVSLNAGVNNIGDVDVLTVPAPLNLTGGGVEASALRVTLANDSTGLLSVDDNAGSLTVDNAALSVVGSGVEATALRVTIASDSTGVVSVDDNGAALTVDNAGTFAVQATLAAGATAIAKAEDVASADADVGVPAMAVRKATPANTSGLDGDYEMLQMSVGRLWVSATVDAALPTGTNNIGDVDILTIAAGDNNIGNVDVVTLPALVAGTALIGTVNVQLDASTMRDGAGTALTPKFAIIDAALSGDNTLVAAVTSKKIRVLALYLVAAGTVVVRFESGAAGTALSGQMNLVANTGFVLPFNPIGWFETAVTTLLNLELSAAISVDGSLVYIEV